MSQELHKIQPVFLKVARDLERANRMFRPSFQAIHDQIDVIFDLAERAHIPFDFIEETLSPLSRLAEVVEANQKWCETFRLATAPSYLLTDFPHVHKTWLPTFQSDNRIVEQLQASAALSLSHVSYLLTVAEKFNAEIDLDFMKANLALPEQAILVFLRAFDGITAAYKGLTDSIPDLPFLTQLPAFALPGAAREISLTSYVLEVACNEETQEEEEASDFGPQFINEISQETSECVELLAELDPAFAQMYEGSRSSIQGNNVDRSRHVLVSLRELCNHLLRRLAPDDAVLIWVQDSSLLHNEKPTRKARILYVCRNLNFDPLATFVRKDTTAILALFDVLQRIHELQPELTDDQLHAIHLRTGSWLTYLLKIWKDS